MSENEKPVVKKIPSFMGVYGQHSIEKKVPVLFATASEHSRKPATPIDKFLDIEDKKKKITESIDRLKWIMSQNPNGQHRRLMSVYEDELHSHHGDDTDAAGYKLEDEYKYGRLPPEQKHAINNYTSSSYYLNNYLLKRHRNPETTPPDEWQDKHVSMLKPAVRKRKLMRPLTVFSGITRNPRAESRMADGLVDLPAFTSTSLRLSRALDFSAPIQKGPDDPNASKDKTASHVLKFELPAGHDNGFYIGSHSEHSTEQEHLLGPGRFRMSQEPEIFHHPETGEVHVWTLHPVHPLG